MAEVEGKLLTCDLCGETVLLKYVGDDVRKHEDPPEGWGYWHVGSIVNSTLCLSCNERIREALLACVSGIKEDAHER